MKTLRFALLVALLAAPAAYGDAIYYFTGYFEGSATATVTVASPIASYTLFEPGDPGFSCLTSSGRDCSIGMEPDVDFGVYRGDTVYLGLPGVTFPYTFDVGAFGANGTYNTIEGMTGVLTVSGIGSVPEPSALALLVAPAAALLWRVRRRKAA